MSKNRNELLRDIKSLALLIPGDDYDLYIKQTQQKNLDYVPPFGFLPAMDEKNPKSLNDVELNVLSKSKQNYVNNIFIPVIVEKQAHILKDDKKESEKSAVARWTDLIKKAQTPNQLKSVIEKINLRMKSQTKGKNSQNKSFWKKILGL
jgi:hypothetical protein